jgi:uroporphyrin-III C-methyltransferase
MRGVNQALLLVTGHAAEAENALDWRLVAQLGQPIVFYMALRTIGRIARALTAHGFSPATPAAVIAAATTPQERITVCSLDQLEAAAASFDPALPAITVIGGIVAVRDELMALQERIRCLLPA